MARFEIEALSPKGPMLVHAPLLLDARGRFRKTFEKETLSALGLDFAIAEMYVSSSHKGVVRGLHFQTDPWQAKYIYPIAGRIFDVVVDLRHNSGNLGITYCTELDASNGTALYVPKGFAHGFMALEDESTIACLCDEPYDAASDSGIRFDDPQLSIPWPDLQPFQELTISDKDKQLMSFAEYTKQHTYPHYPKDAPVE